MTQHITKELSILIAKASGLYETLKYGCPGAADWISPGGIDDELTNTLNAAIQHYIDTAARAQPVSGWKLVPIEPTEAMWGELARDIVFWLSMNSGPHYGSKMYEHLRNLGREIPEWLAKEIPDSNHTPPKGTVAVCIYKAMIAAAPTGEHG
jgi:hypothetical protein